MANTNANVIRIYETMTVAVLAPLLDNGGFGISRTDQKLVAKDTDGTVRTFSVTGTDIQTLIQNGTSSVECSASSDVSITPPTGSKIHVTDDVIISPVTDNGTKSIILASGPTPATGPSLQLTPNDVTLASVLGLDYFNVGNGSSKIQVGSIARFQTNATDTDISSPNGTNFFKVSNTLCVNTNDVSEYDADATNTATVNKTILEDKLGDVDLEDVLTADNSAGNKSITNFGTSLEATYGLNITINKGDTTTSPFVVSSIESGEEFMNLSTDTGVMTLPESSASAINSAGNKAVLTKEAGDANYNPTVTTVNTATYDLLTTDKILHVTYTATGAVTSLTLPTVQATTGRLIRIKDAGGNAGTNNITIDTQGAETIDGSATAIINGDYDSVTIYSDGTNWFIV